MGRSGAAPLLQWVVLPPAVLIAVRGALMRRGTHRFEKET